MRKKRKPPEQSKSIFELQKESGKTAKQLAKDHVDDKPIIYLLKN